MTKKQFLKELEKSFSEVDKGGAIENTSGGPLGGMQEYYVWVGGYKGNLFARDALHFFVENEGTPKERAFVPHPEREKQKKFEEEFRKKVDSFQLS